jgi:hypothetical protein
MMYCLRTFLPLLLLPLPLSLSPIHLATLLALTYILNRPCVYCSFLLVILFASSCHWSGRCFWGNPLSEFSTTLGTFGGNANATDGLGMEGMNMRDMVGDAWGWLPFFVPRLYSTPYPHSPNTSLANNTDAQQLAPFLWEIANSTLATLGAAGAQSADEALSKILPSIALPPSYAAGGVGTGWLRSLLGRGEWVIPCVGVRVVL